MEVERDARLVRNERRAADERREDIVKYGVKKGVKFTLPPHQAMGRQAIREDGEHFGPRMDTGTARDGTVLVIDTRRGGKAAPVLFATCMVCVRGPWVPRGRVARQGRGCTFPP